MTGLVWFLSHLAVPLSAVAMVVLLATWPRNLLLPITGWLVMRRVRFEQELRSRAPRGPGEDAGSSFPRLLPVPAGGEARGPDFVAALPPAPSALVGAVSPAQAAPTRLQRGGRR